MPKADRDWKSYLGAKEEDRKKVDRLTRKYRPLTDDVVREHPVGEQKFGLCPLLQDETCWLLAVDFDMKTWQQDAAAFLAACREFEMPAALERSGSGDGGHVWIFFEHAIPATTARKLGCTILTRTMESRHQLGLDSYDRFFPNQDTMPKGRFGNPIAHPLQKAPRANGNSFFIDGEFRPYPNQWAFRASIKRMLSEEADATVLEAQRRGDLIGVRTGIPEDDDIDPWMLPPSRTKADRQIAGPFPKQVQVVQSNLVYVERNGLPSAMLNGLLRLAVFQNPEFYKAQAMRLPTFNKPRVIACGEDLANYIALPRGCIADVAQLLETHKINIVIRDERLAGHAINVEFTGQLRPTQQDTAVMVAEHDQGILCAPTAFGKTALAAGMIAARKVNTLVLAHRQQLLDQWHARLAMFLNIPAKSIGQVSGGKSERKRPMILTSESFDAVPAGLPEPFRRMVMVAQCLGLRISEIRGLQWGNFDTERRQRLVQRSVVNGSGSAGVDAPCLYPDNDERLRTGNAIVETGRSLNWCSSLCWRAPKQRFFLLGDIGSRFDFHDSCKLLI